MVCGSLMAWGPHGVRMTPDADPAKIWDAVAEALYRIRRSDRLHGQMHYVMVKDIAPPEDREDLTSAANRLKDYLYHNHSTEPNMVLHVDPDWTSFEDYLAGLNKKYRKAARTILKKVEDAGMVIQHSDHVPSDSIDSIHGLYLQTYSRAKVRLFQLRSSFLAEVGKVLGPENFRCSMIRNNANKIVGFVTTIKDGDTAIGFYLGVDYQANDSSPIYLRLLYSVIEDALDMGCSRISFGRTALEPKARLGCVPEEMSVSIRHRVPLLNLLIQPLLDTIHHDEPPERSPFKLSK
jgi:predicted N-acyltransferase